jgi:hypothetical protein
MNVAVAKLVLGNRELGWECWTGKEVMEYTSKQLKDIIKAGKKVCGLKISETTGELELDENGFFTTNMMVHSHIGSWKPMNEESMANLLYTCIGSHEEAGKTVYDCISSRWEQTTMTEADMKAYLKIGIVASGARLLDGDKIVVASTELEKKAEEPKVTEEPKQAAEPKKSEEPKKAEAPKVTEKATAAKAAGKEAGKEKK